jgi:hypothetical protein
VDAHKSILLARSHASLLVVCFDLMQITNRKAGEIRCDVPIITNYLSVNMSRKMPVGNEGRFLQDIIHPALLNWSLDTSLLVHIWHSKLQWHVRFRHHTQNLQKISHTRHLVIT